MYRRKNNPKYDEYDSAYRQTAKATKRHMDELADAEKFRSWTVLSPISWENLPETKYEDYENDMKYALHRSKLPLEQYRQRNNPDGSTLVFAMLIGVGFWYLYQSGQLPSLKQGGSTTNLPDPGGWNKGGGAVGISPTNPATPTQPALPAGVSYCGFEKLHATPKSTHFTMTAKMQYVAGYSTAVYDGILTANQLGQTVGVVGKDFFLWDAQKCQQFAVITTEANGKFHWERQLKSDESEGYYVFAYFPGTSGQIGPITVPGLDEAVSDIFHIDGAPANQLAHHSRLKALVYRV